MKVTSESHTIRLPSRVVAKMVRASVVFADLHDELEDFLIASQPALVKKLRRARREHLTGKTHPFVWPR